MTLAGPVFRQHDAAGGEPANVAIARFEFHFAGKRDHAVVPYALVHRAALAKVRPWPLRCLAL